ncbi:MAG: hypothetical protein ACPHDQ_01365 [Candidatus Thalassarchaeaceae archaeon]
MEEVEVDTIDEDLADASQVRLSDVELPFKLEERNSRLAPLDSLIQEYTFHGKMIFQQWGVTEAMVIGIGTLSIILGAWDLGIGEIASGGDYNRWGLYGDEAGFLHVNDFSLMLALLSIIAWIGFFALLWTRFPLMRENLVWLMIATLAVQLGFVVSHSSATDFPFGTSAGNWAGFAIGNLVLIFLAVIVVHRAVIETRDIHVEERHTHPDPRVVQKAWRDHSLKAWSLNLATWMIFLNISSWAGAHAVSPRPPIENDMTLYVVIYALFGIISMALLVHVLWYPQFMLGAAGDRIQSVRAREVAGEFVPKKASRSQGSCPICSADSVAIRNQDGSIQVPCSNCDGNGAPGTACTECNTIIPARISCRECGSSTTVMSHFSRSDAW